MKRLDFVFLLDDYISPDGRLSMLLGMTAAQENCRTAKTQNAKAFGRIPGNLGEAIDQETVVKTTANSRVLTSGEPGIFSYPSLFMAGY